MKYEQDKLPNDDDPFKEAHTTSVQMNFSTRKALTTMPPFTKTKTGAVLLLISVASVSVTVLFNVALHQYERYQQEQRYKSFLNQAESWKVQQKYQNCLTVVTLIPPEAEVAQEAHLLEAECQDELVSSQLKNAQNLANSGYLRAAIAVAQAIPNGASDARVSQFVIACSRRILQIAENYYLDPSDRFNDALSVISAIASDNPLYLDASNLRQEWRAQWTANSDSWRSAQLAMSVGDLATATNALQQMTDHPFWNYQADELAQTIKRQQEQYGNLLGQAQWMLARGDSENAVALVVRLPNFSPWNEQKTQLLMQAQSLYPKTQPDHSRVSQPVSYTTNQPSNRGLGSIGLFLMLAGIFSVVELSRRR